MMSNDTKQLAAPVTDADHQTGPAGAPVTLVEYGDFQCEDTAAVLPTLKELRDRMGSDLRFVYRSFPLTHEHDFAQGAAEAAEAAGAQGGFWPFHDHLFAHQDALTVDDLVAYARALGLNADRIRQALDAGTYRARVNAIKQGGEQSGVNSTPSFFINGQLYTGPHELDAMLKAVRAAGGETA
jgi:protein-disulfide isomerase